MCLCAVLQTCVRGEQRKFVAGETKPIDRGMIACVVAGASVATRHPYVNVQLSQEPSYMNGEIWEEFHWQLDDVERHLQSLRSRVSSLSSAHVQFSDEPEAAQRQQ